MTTTTLAKRTITDLEHELAAATKAVDAPITVTLREEALRRRDILERRIAYVASDIQKLAAVDRDIARITHDIAFLTASRETLSRQLLACVVPTVGDDRAKKQEEQALKLSLATIAHGAVYLGAGMCQMGAPLSALMKEAGYTPTEGQTDVWSGIYGSLPVCEKRLIELTQQQVELQQRIDRELAT